LFFGDYEFIMEKMKLAPDDVDILVTHSPHNTNKAFLEFKKNLKSLKAHLWGHVHMKYGYSFENNVLNLNAANDAFDLQEPPHYFDYYY
jgi:predicted nucleotidyltransferase